MIVVGWLQAKWLLREPIYFPPPPPQLIVHVHLIVPVRQCPEKPLCTRSAVSAG
jgi:hypothetical protein